MKRLTIKEVKEHLENEGVLMLRNDETGEYTCYKNNEPITNIEYWSIFMETQMQLSNEKIMQYCQEGIDEKIYHLLYKNSEPVQFVLGIPNKELPLLSEVDLNDRIRVFAELTEEMEKLIDETISMDSVLHGHDKQTCKICREYLRNLESEMKMDDRAEKLVEQRDMIEREIRNISTSLSKIFRSILAEFQTASWRDVVDNKYPGLSDRYNAVFSFVENMDNVDE